MRRRWWFVLPVGIFVLLALSLSLQLDFPRPSGAGAIGRTTWRWTDGDRPEPLTDDPDDNRQIVVEVWYPGVAGTGTMTGYLPDSTVLADALAAGGEVSRLEVWGMSLVRYHARQDAAVADGEGAYPVILLSPGNATNVEFYAALADELASRGYIVVGLNHPYDVAAVALMDDKIASFVPGPLDPAGRAPWTVARVAERVADLRFALDQLEQVNGGMDERFAGRLDLSRVGVMGHSLGGVAAAMACRADERLDACLNLDGLQRGGPFSTDEDSPPPQQPFMLITKEEALHPVLAERFAAVTDGSYRVVIHGASHDSFTDGPVLMPSPLPWPNAADRNLELTRAYTTAFFDQVLRSTASELLARESDGDTVSVEIYRSGQG